MKFVAPLHRGYLHLVAAVAKGAATTDLGLMMTLFIGLVLIHGQKICVKIGFFFQIS
jgi:hypothetical protein